MANGGGCRPAMVFRSEFWIGFIAGAIVALLAGKLFGLF
jgi:hypothetical protein